MVTYCLCQNVVQLLNSVQLHFVICVVCLLATNILEVQKLMFQQRIRKELSWILMCKAHVVCDQIMFYQQQSMHVFTIGCLF